MISNDSDREAEQVPYIPRWKEARCFGKRLEKRQTIPASINPGTKAAGW